MKDIMTNKKKLNQISEKEVICESLGERLS